MEKTFYFRGKYFSSIKEFTTEYNLPYQQTVNKLNDGYTLEQIVSGEKKSDTQPNPWHIAIEYKGKSYSSLRKFCQENNLKYQRIYKLQREGLSIEEIIEKEGIVIESSETDSITTKDGDYLISRMTSGIRRVFEDNPYCVLGIKCNSVRVEALNARDKLEKLNRLGAALTYKSEYDLVGVEKPDRDLGHIQVVLNNLDKMDYRWFWFLSSEYSAFWKDELVFENFNDMDFQYDHFLACYLNAMITDPGFVDRKKWIKLFRILNSMLSMPDNDLYKVLSERLIESERAKYNYRMVVGNFKDVIQDPLFSTVETSDGKLLLNVIEIVTDSEGEIQNKLKDRISGLAIKWVDDCLVETKTAMDAINVVKRLNNANRTEANNIYNCLLKLEKNCFRTAESIAEHLDDLHSEMLMDRIKGVVYDATIALTAGGRKKDACHFDSMIYIYCTDKQKEEIKKVYPNEWLEIPDSEFSVEECRRIAGRFESNRDWKNGFIWMMKAAKKGDAASQNDIGVYYALGRGRQTDGKVAFEWFEKAAKGGNAVAYGNLAYRYYDGTFPCSKDREKAKEYWIRAYKIDKDGKYKDVLDEKFPGWRHEKHSLLTFSEKDWRYRVKSYAEDGILDAQYRYGILLYYGRFGCSEDKNAARRWLLKAAVYNHPLAIKSLKELYGIDAGEGANGTAMHNIGLRYGSDNTEQGKDLRFYWYYKAVVNDCDDAVNKVGVCFDGGIGTEKDNAEANKYFLRAIEKGNHWAMHNYALNLFYGCGVDEDKDKAKELMIRARDKGNTSAKEFLKEHFGIESDFRVFTFSDLANDLTIYDGSIRIDFCGLDNSVGKTVLKFWVSNSDLDSHQIWIKNVKVNGASVGSIKSLGVFKNGQSDFCTEDFDFSQKDNIEFIEFQIEVDDEGTTELFTIDTVKVTLYNRIHSMSCEQIKGTGRGKSYSPSYEEDEDEEEGSYDFACEDFDDVMIYDDGSIRVEFGGFEVEDDQVFAKIWSKNTSKKIYRLWAKDIVVDENRVSEYEEITTAMPDGSWESNNLLIEGVDLDVYYDVELTIEINDENNTALALSKRIKCRIDFSEEEIDVELIEHRDYDDEEADSDDDDEQLVQVEDDEEDDPFGLDSYLYVEDSFCMKNPEHNGLELYFPEMPAEFIRATMKEQGWRWHRQKGCWYARNNAENYALAVKITGNNVKG